MDKFTIIRSMVGANGRHDAGSAKPAAGILAINPREDGRAWARCFPHARRGGHRLPPFVGLAPDTSQSPGVTRAAPVSWAGAWAVPAEQGRRSERRHDLNGINLNRLDGRRSLLTQFDQLRRDVDTKRQMEGLDAFNQQALAMLTSARLRRLNLIRKIPSCATDTGAAATKSRPMALKVAR